MQETPISFPAKCFLWGEYSVLYEGMGILATFSPFFTLKVKKKFSLFCPFHENSPAGIFWQEKKDFFSSYELFFSDPYAWGGLGRSTAEFASLYSFWFQKNFSQRKQEEFVHQAWESYREIYKDHSILPSGFDLISQLVAVPDGKNYSTRLWRVGKGAKSWEEIFLSSPIPCLLVSTGKKKATHEHLLELKFNKACLSALESITEKAYQGILEYDKKQEVLEILACSMKEWSAVLGKEGLLASHTKKLYELFSSIPGVLAMKGCGAMGADLVAILVDLHKREAVIERIRMLGYTNIYDCISHSWVDRSIEREKDE